MLDPKYRNSTAEELSTLLQFETININDISLKDAKQRDAFFKAISVRAHLLKNVAPANENHFLIPAIEKIPGLFIYLNKEQYTDKLAQLYLTFRLSESDAIKNTVHNNFGLTVQNSIDDKVLLNYSYVTRDDEEVYYFDNELQVPAPFWGGVKEVRMFVGEPLRPMVDLSIRGSSFRVS